jgi:hypothetical protein
MSIRGFLVKTVASLLLLAGALSFSASAQAQLWDGGFVGGSYPSNVSLGTGTVHLVSISATAPSTNCPCRASVEYFVPIESPSTSGGKTAVETWVTDGTNTFADDVIGITTANTVSSMGASGLSTVTYSNSQNVTFTLEILALKTGWTADQFTTVAGSENYFRVLFLPSD